MVPWPSVPSRIASAKSVPFRNSVTRSQPCSARYRWATTLHCRPSNSRQPTTKFPAWSTAMSGYWASPPQAVSRNDGLHPEPAVYHCALISHFAAPTSHPYHVASAFPASSGWTVSNPLSPGPTSSAWAVSHPPVVVYRAAYESHEFRNAGHPTNASPRGFARTMTAPPAEVPTAPIGVAAVHVPAEYRAPYTFVSEPSHWGHAAMKLPFPSADTPAHPVSPSRVSKATDAAAQPSPKVKWCAYSLQCAPSHCV